MDGSRALAAIERLCAHLSEGTKTASALAAELGSTVEDQGPGLAIVVRPTDPAFREARVARTPQGDGPAYVELTLSDPAALPLSALRDAFGTASTLPRSRPGAARRFLLQRDSAGQPYTCAIIASLHSPGDDAAPTVSAVTLRRDERTGD
jgi:hypothetical protein